MSVGFNNATALPQSVTGYGQSNLFSRVLAGGFGSPTGVKTRIGLSDLVALGWKVGAPTEGEVKSLVIGDSSPGGFDLFAFPGWAKFQNSAAALAGGHGQGAAVASTSSGSLVLIGLIVILVLFLLR